MPQKEINSWESYRDAYRTDIPEGKESEYVARVLAGYKLGKQKGVFDRKKADREAARMMKNPLFQEQMKNDPAGMLAMMSKGQYDQMLKTTVSPLPIKKENLNAAYAELKEIGDKMADGSYGMPESKEWKALGQKVKEVTEARQKDPEMSEVKQFMNLLTVYSSFRELDAVMPKKGPEGGKMAKFGFDLLTALGGGKEAVGKRLKEHFDKANREIEKIEREVAGDMGPEQQKPKKAKPEKASEGPVL